MVTISFILYSQLNCIQNKTPNNGILLKGVLIPKLLSNHFASRSFTNLDFLNRHSVHFDCIINLPFFVLKIFEFFYKFYTIIIYVCFITYIGKEKKSFTNCSKSYLSFILSKNILSVKNLAHFDFSFAFLSDIKTYVYGCEHSVCLLQFLQ